MLEQTLRSTDSKITQREILFPWQYFVSVVFCFFFFLSVNVQNNHLFQVTVIIFPEEIYKKLVSADTLKKKHSPKVPSKQEDGSQNVQQKG